MNKYVYSFNEGSREMKHLLGGKGANLAEMTKIGLPVPYGFTITTEACNRYYSDGHVLSDALLLEIKDKMKEVEEVTSRRFGDSENPLLLSVRSGAVFSMPGMMDTVLNLGLNDDTVEALAVQTSNRRFAYDSYRRFIQMFADVVMGADKSEFEKILDAARAERGADSDNGLTAEDMEAVTAEFKTLYKKLTGESFPQDPEKQLEETVKAVFRSWNNDRAVLYRRLNNIPSDLGTAVNVQAMVFGNMGDDSGTGVAFTRNPATGEKEIFGEFLVNAQGEDVVAGVRTPENISHMKDKFPEVYRSFEAIADLLEKHYTDMQDMEFTVEKNKLYMLQTRDGKRTAEAAVKIAVDMLEEGLIDRKTALMRINPSQIEQLLHQKFDDKDLASGRKILTGLPASPGAATGRVYFSAQDVEAASERGEKAVLVRQETSPEDLAGMIRAEGILTSRGGMTSHAAVVARGMGKCCVAGCHDAVVDEDMKELRTGEVTVKEGEFISLDGNTGSVYLGEIKTVEPGLSGEFSIIMNIADEMRTMKVRANADNMKDALKAVEYGAEGIGLCRTEHMFFDEERIRDMRKMIMASDSEERKKALASLMPYQKNDFMEIFSVMGEKPVNIRLLDPPLHEFLPSGENEIIELAQDMNISAEKVRERVLELKEFNPMLGHRGCRLAITYPEIVVMQTEAIISAAVEVKEKTGAEVMPEIMVPLIATDREFMEINALVRRTADRIIEEKGVTLKYQVGTMIEIPRAALVADRIAEHAEFFSFGTNDLTQMTYGFSRDDTGSILNEYIEKGILEKDPFQTIDREGVGVLMERASVLGRRKKENLKLGICGEHGGDPESVEFCNSLGLNYVSCSPYRVPVARMAAAQAAVRAAEKADEDMN